MFDRQFADHLREATEVLPTVSLTMASYDAMREETARLRARVEELEFLGLLKGVVAAGTFDAFEVLNGLAKELWNRAQSKGFHDEPVHIATHCANLTGEVSELWEAYRRGQLDKPCDKTAELTCAEEELADIVIRALDMAHDMGVDIGRAVRIKDQYNSTRPFKHNKVA